MLNPFGGVSTLLINGVPYRMVPNFQVPEFGVGSWTLSVVGAPMWFTFRGIAAGGGGGWANSGFGGAGGGGGAYISALAIVLNPGVVYTLFVPNGGGAGAHGPDLTLIRSGVTLIQLQGGRAGSTGLYEISRDRVPQIA